MAPFLVGLVLVSFGSPAQAEAARCSVTATPEMPSAAAEAFSREDIHFSASAAVRCFDANDAAVTAEVCIAARREQVSGTVDLLRGSTRVPYMVTAGGVTITTQEVEVWSGMLDASGLNLVINFSVRARDFVGFISGSYQATVTWSVNFDPGIC